MLAAAHLRIRLGRRVILDGVDFAAATGAMTAIVGPNGSGKTTLLRALTGEIAPEAGRIALAGRDIAGLRPVELAGRRGVLAQATGLAFPFTVHEVVRLGLQSGFATAPSVEAALEAVDLPGFGGRFYQELSGGEQQRVQLARVLAQVWAPVVDGEPRWLFLDEPVASLDIGHQIGMMRLAQGYAARGGGVVAVMHDLNLTAMFADHVVLLHGGRVLGAGRPEEVIRDDLLAEAYGCRLRVGQAPPGGPFVLPQSVL